MTDLPEVSGLTIGILGGTGDQGKGLARRFALAGHPVLIGSRDAGRAQEAADSIGNGARGAENAAVAAEADIVIVAVPWDGHKATLSALREPLAGKIVVDCVNPLGFDKQGAYALPVEEGSAAQQARGGADRQPRGGRLPPRLRGVAARSRGGQGGPGRARPGRRP
ncbi:hypothetical protein GCM10020219_082300 [Nonomuraea dietziae]